MLLNSGQIAGTTPFFHLFINDDTPEQPPLTVVLGTGFEMEGDFPNGTTTFDVPGEPNMRGQLKVSSCS